MKVVSTCGAEFLLIFLFCSIESFGCVQPNGGLYTRQCRDRKVQYGEQHEQDHEQGYNQPGCEKLVPLEDASLWSCRLCRTGCSRGRDVHKVEEVKVSVIVFIMLSALVHGSPAGVHNKMPRERRCDSLERSR